MFGVTAGRDGNYWVSRWDGTVIIRCHGGTGRSYPTGEILSAGRDGKWRRSGNVSAEQDGGTILTAALPSRPVPSRPVPPLPPLLCRRNTMMGLENSATRDEEGVYKMKSM